MNEDVKEIVRRDLDRWLQVTQDTELLATQVILAIEAHQYRIVHPDWTTGTINDVLARARHD